MLKLVSSSFLATGAWILLNTVPINEHALPHECTCDTIKFNYMYIWKRNHRDGPILWLGQRLQTTFEASHMVFFYINVALTLIGYRKPPKLDYCFITSTSLVPVGLGFSITGLRNESEAARNTASSFLEHAQIINHRCRLHKWAWQLKVWMRTKRTKVWTLLPALPHTNTIYSRTSSLVHPWVKHKNSKHT